MFDLATIARNFVLWAIGGVVLLVIIYAILKAGFAALADGGD